MVNVNGVVKIITLSLLGVVLGGGLLSVLPELSAQAKSEDSIIEVVVINPTPIPTVPPVPTPVPSLSFPNSGSGSSDASAPSCNQPNPGEQAPYIFRATRISETAVELEFTAADKPWTHYLLRYGFARQPFSFGAVIETPETGRFQVGDLASGKSYQFQMLAVNGCAPGPDSNTLTVTLGGHNQDSLVGQFAATPGLAVGESVLAPDQVLPLEPVTGEGAAAGALEETGAFEYGERGNWSWSQFLEGLINWKSYCPLTWWWLCWPWGLLIALALVVFWCWHRQQRQKHSRSTKPRSKKLTVRRRVRKVRG
jgi:hypothetical protein